MMRENESGPAKAKCAVNDAPPPVILDNVSLAYPTRTTPIEALREVSLRIGPAEKIAVVGPSGSGKTSLLRLITGLTVPTKGTVLVDGKKPATFRQEHAVGFVFQKPCLLPWRTLLQNLLLPVQVGHRPLRDGAEERALELLRVLGLEGFERAYPAQLSGGMLQRASLARTLMTRPALVSLDEPFSALDEITRERLWLELVPVLRNASATVVLVTHHLVEAAFLADRVLVLSPRPGSVVADFPINVRVPRTRALFDDREFLRLCAQIREAIKC